jgi:hypothetical protein
MSGAALYAVDVREMTFGVTIDRRVEGPPYGGSPVHIVPGTHFRGKSPSHVVHNGYANRLCTSNDVHRYPPVGKFSVGLCTINTLLSGCSCTNLTDCRHKAVSLS